MKLALLTAVTIAGSFSAIASDIAKLEDFIAGGNFWNVKAEGFANTGTTNKPYVKWLSADERTDARYPGSRNSPEIKFFDLKVYEAIFHFKEGLMDSIEFTIYNRGDAGDWSEELFKSTVARVSGEISEWIPDYEPVSCPRTRLASGMGIERREWVRNGTTAVTLLWSATDRGPEYIKVRISRYNPEKDPRMMQYSLEDDGQQNLKATASADDLKANVKTDDKGNVFIKNIPMVDQGKKGYCAVATSERVLRYYGVTVDQHVIAQLAGSTADEGTDPDRMYEMLKRVGLKFGVKIRELDSPDRRNFERVFRDYNTVARRQDKPLLPPLMLNVAYHYSYSDCYERMNLEILREARCGKDEKGFCKFKEDVTGSVDAGIPLLWGLMLGKVEEPYMPQTAGGHMRLIKGYNKDTGEIIYSDSWGAKHDWKTMKMEDAWAVTTGLYSIELLDTPASP